MQNIVIAPCGNKSDMFNDHWLNKKAEKQFDVCLLFYHEKINNPELYKDVEYFYHLKDFKYHMLYKLFTEVQPDWLKQYKYFYFLDDPKLNRAIQCFPWKPVQDSFSCLARKPFPEKDSLHIQT